MADRFPFLRLDNGTLWSAPLTDPELLDKLNCYDAETVTLQGEPLTPEMIRDFAREWLGHPLEKGLRSRPVPIPPGPAPRGPANIIMVPHPSATTIGATDLRGGFLCERGPLDICFDGLACWECRAATCSGCAKWEAARDLDGRVLCIDPDDDMAVA